MVKNTLELENNFKRALDLYNKMYTVMQSVESYEYLLKHMGGECRTIDRLVLQERSHVDRAQVYEEFARDINKLITDYVMNDGEES